MATVDSISCARVLGIATGVAALRRAMHLHPWRQALLLVGLALSPATLPAQELEARAYAPNPVGARFAVVSYAHSEGDMLLQGSSPIEDFEIRADTLALGLGGTFAIGNRLGSLALVMPLVDGTATGRLNGIPERVDRTGAADARLRLGVSLLPDTAVDLQTFSRDPPERTLAASAMLVVPTGEYFEDKLINIGTNRWALKTELGGFRRLGRWAVDGSAGVWVFADNDDYLGDQTRAQEPIGTLQANVSYTFAPRLWLGFGATWYSGGEVEIDGVAQRNRQSNSRAGLTLAVPLGQWQSLKLACSTGVTARFGGDLDTCSLTWQILWFRR